MGVCVATAWLACQHMSPEDTAWYKDHWASLVSSNATDFQVEDDLPEDSATVISYTTTATTGGAWAQEVSKRDSCYRVVEASSGFASIASGAEKRCPTVVAEMAIRQDGRMFVAIAHGISGEGKPDQGARELLHMLCRCYPK